MAEVTSVSRDCKLIVTACALLAQLTSVLLQAQAIPSPTQKLHDQVVVIFSEQKSQR